jgi:hypothetical protein
MLSLKLFQAVGPSSPLRSSSLSTLSSTIMARAGSNDVSYELLGCEPFTAVCEIHDFSRVTDNYKICGT